MPMMTCFIGGFTSGDRVEIEGGFDGKDVANVSTGGGWTTALICEHVLCKRLLQWVLGGALLRWNVLWLHCSLLWIR
jgi:hypothetical protein